MLNVTCLSPRQGLIDVCHWECQMSSIKPTLKTILLPSAQYQVHICMWSVRIVDLHSLLMPGGIILTVVNSIMIAFMKPSSLYIPFALITPETDRNQNTCICWPVVLHSSTETQRILLTIIRTCLGKSHRTVACAEHFKADVWYQEPQLIGGKGSCDPSNPDIRPQRSHVLRSRSSMPRGIDHQHPRMLPPKSLCHWARRNKRNHKGVWDVYRLQAGPSGQRALQSVIQAIVCSTGDHRDHSDCVRTPVSQVQRPGTSRAHLRRSVWIVTFKAVMNYKS